jgi:hypothetical protein
METNALDGIIALIELIAICALICVFCIAPYWVYSDALDKGYDGITWFVLVWFFNIPALLIYIIFFRGIAPAPMHKATKNEWDVAIRSGFRKQEEAEQARASSENKFTDEKLDKLIETGKFAEAREYVRDIIKVSAEMKDTITPANYSRYLSRLEKFGDVGSRKVKVKYLDPWGIET